MCDLTTPPMDAESEKALVELDKLKTECELKKIELARNKSTFSSIIINPIYLGAAVTLWVGCVTAAVTAINGYYSLKIEEAKLRNTVSIERDKIGSAYFQEVLSGKDLNEISAKLIYVLEACLIDDPQGRYNLALVDMLKRAGAKDTAPVVRNCPGTDPNFYRARGTSP